MMMRRNMLGIRTGFALVAVLAVSAASVQAEDRAIDGTGNNVANPEWGAAFTRLIRLGPVMYADGISSPAGANRPSAREVSNQVVVQIGLMENGYEMTDWVWQWGQFLDHDISLSEFMVPVEPFDIAVPMGDPQFDPDGTGEAVIALDRSVYDPTTGTDIDNPRQQINEITSYIDGSNVYGSDVERAAWLRTFEGGKLKMSEGELLPYSDGTVVNAGPGGLPSFSTDLFTAGDIRCNEQLGLTSIHTLFAREHNRRCDLIAAAHPTWTDERIYQRARKEVGALVQVITFYEFLPALLGEMAPDPEAGSYDPAANATIANEFANAIYRLGHTLLSPEVMRLDESGREIPEGNLSLREAFFRPDRLVSEGGIEPILRGLAKKRAQEFDNRVVDDVRNFLFGAPGQGGLDLPSLNMQRGRDHGLPDYNTMREVMGLDRVEDFDEITSNVETREGLRDVYGTVDDIDLWVGALSEDHMPNSGVGELIAAVAVNQFTRLRDGDRFWYARDPAFTAGEIEELTATRLSDVIRWNTSIEKIQDDVFHMAAEEPPPPPPTAGFCGAFSMSMVGVMMLGLAGMRGSHRRRR